MKLNIFFIGIFTLIVAIIPSTSHAHLPVASSTTILDENFTLFTITYEFNFANNSLLMPISAVRNLDKKSTSTNLGFVINNNDQVATSSGTVSAVILSDNKIVNGRYFSPERKRSTYTLVALLNTKNSPNKTVGNIGLEVTSLPFNMIRASTSKLVGLNPSELITYRTPTVQTKI